MATTDEKNLILDLFGRQKFAEAMAAAHRYLEQVPTDLRILEVLADSALNSGHLDIGIRAAEFLVAQERTPYRLASLAMARSSAGEIAEAIGLLREGLAADPTHPRCWNLISTLHRFGKNDSLIAKAKRMLRDKSLPAVSRRAILYAMCKAMNDLGKWDRAWDYAADAAGLSTPDYDPGEFERWNADIETAFDPEFLRARIGRGALSSAPIFIVGMPRSGTTLMEIVLAATSQVAPMGELTTIPEFTERAIRDDLSRGHPASKHGWTRRWRDDAFTGIGEAYLGDVARRAGGTLPDAFTDKLPGNVLYLGQIALALPNARIIRMRRDPLDTCVSCFMGEFNGGHDYTYRVDWLAQAAKGYQQAWDLLAPMLPNPALEVRYEDLVTRSEAEIKRVLGFLDLEWTPDCLTPAPLGYTATTRSVEQVRRPITAASVGRWRRYANRIEPLAKALGVDLSQVA